jgi:hypothetical protein
VPNYKHRKNNAPVKRKQNLRKIKIRTSIPKPKEKLKLTETGSVELQVFGLKLLPISTKSLIMNFNSVTISKKMTLSLNLKN